MTLAAVEGQPRAVEALRAALRSGQAELALAGGVNLTLTPPNFVCSTKIGSISADGYERKSVRERRLTGTAAA